MKLIAKNKINTKYGYFNFLVFKDKNNREHLAIVKGNVKNGSNIICRVHSACLVGETFHSTSCTCYEELRQAMELCQRTNKGILIWLNHCNISYLIKNFDLMIKRKTKRYFIDAAEIIKKLKIKSIKLLTNNQEKVKQLQQYGIKITKTVNPIPKKK